MSKDNLIEQTEIMLQNYIKQHSITLQGNHIILEDGSKYMRGNNNHILQLNKKLKGDGYGQ